MEKHEDETFSLNTTLIFPKGSAVKMTLEGRRKRLREAVATVLVQEGWKRLGNDISNPSGVSFRRSGNVFREAKPEALEEHGGGEAALPWPCHAEKSLGQVYNRVEPAVESSR